MTRDVLDEKCPNVAYHRGTDKDRRHHIDYITWLGLLHDQLGRTLDDGIIPLWKQGARGVLFQVTLLTYGYTFVSKATIARFIPELEHEAKVYERLRPLQGVHVPVFLGAVDLREVGRTYYYDIGVHIIYMILLSWGGRSLHEIKLSDKANLKQAVIQSMQALHVHGVVHTDVRDANVLWNEETKKVMVIDFERAELVECPQPTQGVLAPHKRKRRVGENTTASKPMSKSEVLIRHKMQNDIFEARGIFFNHSY
jgi:serine/threonine protein kinase